MQTAAHLYKKYSTKTSRNTLAMTGSSKKDTTESNTTNTHGNTGVDDGLLEPANPEGPNHIQPVQMRLSQGKLTLRNRKSVLEEEKNHGRNPDLDHVQKIR